MQQILSVTSTSLSLVPGGFFFGKFLIIFLNGRIIASQVVWFFDR